MSPSLEQLRAASLLSSLDVHFARCVGRLGGESRPDALLAAALTSRETASGHACLDLATFESLDLSTSFSEADPLPDRTQLREVLSSSPLVASAEDLAPTREAALREVRPLVLDAAGRVYLRRYWEFQCRLAEAVRTRAQSGCVEFDEALLMNGLDRLFERPVRDTTALDPAAGDQVAFDFSDTAQVPPLDRQRLAAAIAVARRFAVISGGPGTGKTATAGKILALIVEQELALRAGAPPRIALVAPTGKAAATLGAAIVAAVDELDCTDEIKAVIPRSALTIHRCLGVRGGALPSFRHGPDHLLPIDAVLVDEASMVDLALMTRLLAAVPHQARVILLGDEHQLASVEAGAVLGDICKTAEPGGYSSAFAERLDRWMHAPVERAAVDDRGAVRDSIVRLTHSYRYDPKRGIGALARAINQGDVAGALEILDGDDHPEVARLDFEARGEGYAQLHREIVEGFGGILTEVDPEAMIGRFSAFRVLCPLRQGRGGVEELNREIESVLQRAGRIRSTGGNYTGRPVLVKTNDYAQELFNGDVGFVLPDERGVAFPGVAGAMRVFAAPRLPDHETAFAMTIHKSQGSEFDRVAIVITDSAAQRASRQLLYTAVTRAREGVTLYASKDAIAQAVERETRRSSGLGDALGSPT